jgi:hypothetical protein
MSLNYLEPDFDTAKSIDYLTLHYTTLLYLPPQSQFICARKMQLPSFTKCSKSHIVTVIQMLRSTSFTPIEKVIFGERDDPVDGKTLQHIFEVVSSYK